VIYAGMDPNSVDGEVVCAIHGDIVTSG